MALFKQFSGRVYNENGIEISNIRFRGYHRQSNKWSGWYYSLTETQYDMNLGDDQWLTQDGSVSVNDDILLVIETLEDNVYERRFALVITKITSVDTRIINVMLKQIQYPNINTLWYLRSTTDGSSKILWNTEYLHIGRIGDTIEAIENANDESSWSFDGNIMYHKLYYFNQPIFTDRLGITEVLYKWTDSYVSSNSYVYNTIANGNDYYEVYAKAINKKGLESISLLKIQIRNNQPITSITWSPENPSVDDLVNIETATVDEDLSITNIEYKFDGSIITNNTDVNYSWDQDLGDFYKQYFPIELTVDWFDGYEDKTYTVTRNIELTNIAPTFDLEQTLTYINGNEANRFDVINLNDPDGNNDNIVINWLVEYKTPIDLTYKNILDTGYSSVTFKEWIFNIPGEYRITVYAKDEFGLVSNKSLEVNIELSNVCEDNDSVRYIEWE